MYSLIRVKDKAGYSVSESCRAEMCRVAVIGKPSIRILSEHVLRTGVGTVQASQ